MREKDETHQPRRKSTMGEKEIDICKENAIDNARIERIGRGIETIEGRRR